MIVFRKLFSELFIKAEIQTLCYVTEKKGLRYLEKGETKQERRRIRRKTSIHQQPELGSASISTLTKNITNITNRLNQMKIKHSNLHHMSSGWGASTLIKFQINLAADVEHLLQQNIFIDGIAYTARLYSEKNEKQQHLPPSQSRITTSKKQITETNHLNIISETKRRLELLTTQLTELFF